MNRQEVTQTLAVLQSRYPQMKTGDPSATVAAWLMTLEDVPAEAVEVALRKWFRESRWAPDPSELRQMVLSQLDALPDPAQAWEMVVRHFRQNGLIGGEPFSGPAVVAETVRAIGGWYHLRMSTDQNADREAFLRAYTTYAKRTMSDVNIAELVSSRMASLASGEQKGE
jgi:hypothetical protein